RLATHDGLTGIANRRSFDLELAHEWRRAARGRHWISLALADVDHFKGFNDLFGHAAGDDCLKAVARAVAGACRRPGDRAHRYRGEEFALMLPETDPEGARDLVRRLLARVQALAIDYPASSCAPHVTISVGIASVIPSDGTGPEPALEAVDGLLYE